MVQPPAAIPPTVANDEGGVDQSDAKDFEIPAHGKGQRATAPSQLCSALMDLKESQMRLAHLSMRIDTAAAIGDLDGVMKFANEDFEKENLAPLSSQHSPVECCSLSLVIQTNCDHTTLLGYSTSSERIHGSPR